jgi:hypothetical protein
MDDDRIEGAAPGARILNFPTPQARSQRTAEDMLLDRASMADDLGAAATNMASIQATVINMLLQQMRQLPQILPQIVDGLIRRPDSKLIAGHWAEAADAQDQLLATIMDVLGKTTQLPISPDLLASTDRSVMRLRSLIAECRRPPEERAVLFGSPSHLRRRVLEEMGTLERNLAALDAVARKAAGLD